MRRSLLLSVATLMAITAGAQGLEYAYDNATMTAKVTYRMKQLGDGTWERIKGGRLHRPSLPLSETEGLGLVHLL